MSISFTVDRSKCGIITGFTLLGVGTDLDVAFCLSFMRAWEFGKAEVEISHKNIVFTHRGIEDELSDARWTPHNVHHGGTFTASLRADEEDVLLELLAHDFEGSRKGIIRPVFRDNGRGFTFFVEPRE